jgi:hypothetical protein
MPIPTHANTAWPSFRTLLMPSSAAYPLYRAGAKRDPRSIQHALRAFEEAVIDFVDSDERP